MMWSATQRDETILPQLMLPTQNIYQMTRWIYFTLGAEIRCHRRLPFEVRPTRFQRTSVLQKLGVDKQRDRLYIK